jgi:nucleoside-diphosphate-sugar epimerase
MSHANKLLLLGTGQVGKAVIKQARGTRHIIASTRNPNRIFEFVELAVEPLIMPLPSGEIVSHLVAGADVLVSFPPDGSADAILAPACADARRIIYISSTGVYGNKSGRIDDSTAPDVSDERSRPRVEAESIWREYGAIVLRAPGIYGPHNGLHKRLAAGTYKMPAAGANLISRIHIDDLAAIILQVFAAVEMSDTTYVVGDEHPCPIAEVVNWLCAQMKLPLPESVSESEVNFSLRGNRAIDGSRILKELGMTLRFADFMAGYQNCLDYNGKFE